MCGLIVAWDPDGLADAVLASARGDLRHRGPDAESSLWRDDRRVHLGHTRLKIIDTSDNANQPFVSPCGRWALVYNGEIYNYRELRAEIGDRWRWRTRSDTEVLLAAWALWGAACLDKLVGMFAFVLHDADAQRLILVRDRFGIKPLYHVTVGHRRICASEIPPLLRFMPRVEADCSTIRTYLDLGVYDHGPYTFFAGVERVEPGCLIDIDLSDGSERDVRWYSLVDHVVDLAGASQAEVLEHTETLVGQAIRSHLVADVAVGLNVSGGVDSSMLIRTTVAELGSAHLFNQDYEGYSELPWVREVSEGGTLHVAELDLPRIEAYLDDTVRMQAEPFGGISICGYNALYEMARDHNVTVLLDGHGADEVFLGYKRYHQLYVASAPSAAEHDRRSTEYTEAWGERPREVQPGASIDGTYGLQPDAMAPRLRAYAPRPVALLDGGLDPVRQAAAADLLYAKIPRGMRFNDHVSMAHSRELRVPFLDHRLVEFAFGIPAAWLLNARGGKALFRDLLARRVPRSIAYASKRSVQSPQREWLAGPWRPLVEAVLRSDSFADRGWVDRGKAVAAYRAYCEGSNENSFFVWQWLNLELWARCYLDAAASVAA
jgi:asparagine synthase (glutamine-hydrolysing)